MAFVTPDVNANDPDDPNPWVEERMTWMLSSKVERLRVLWRKRLGVELETFKAAQGCDRSRADGGDVGQKGALGHRGVWKVEVQVGDIEKLWEGLKNYICKEEAWPWRLSDK